MSKTDTPTDARDYRATVFLPATSFPMKAGLPEAEPKWLARWEQMDLYGRIRRQAKGRPLFVLHDGPPYANGEIHSGTGLNKVLKDIVVRSRGFLGFDAPYIPGWDCHGLPIEWKIEEKYRKEGKSKDDVPIDQLRKDCRDFANHWIDVQRAQFKRLGCMGQWDKPYTTMDYRAEAVIARELHKFVDNKLLYRGFRPVMWSPVEKTALAEAEVEYHEKTSPTIYVKFPVVKGDKSLTGVSIVIWTTTPWTIPGNRAIAYSPTLDYGVYEVTAADEKSLAQVGDKIALADALADQTARDARVTLVRAGNADVKGAVCAHPLVGKGYEFDVPVLPGDHVTADTGTGFVHTAPGHGEEDFVLMTETFPGYAANNPDAFNVVKEDGSFNAHVPLFAGKFILSRDGKKDGDANRSVIAALIEAGRLLAQGTLRHQYPHSWRSKAPVIFRATPQWFAAMDKPIEAQGGATLRQRAMQAIADTGWFPPSGENRMGGMVKDRPDWVLSRQRAWGVPLAIFVEKKTQDILNDPDVNRRIGEAFEAEGADAWYNSPPSRFLGNERDPNDFEQVKDILDVWFDSGSTHVFTVENPLDSSWPKKDHADLYLEGSDQHRGWFQSSLLESCATRGRAPYDQVLTAGFVLDREGDKMSKSVGNVILPQTIADKNGADIFRLWVASSDFTQDLRMGNDIIQSNTDAYRRLRNTIRFMLANLDGFDEKERVAPVDMPELERFILAKLAELDAIVRESYTVYDFNRVYNTVFSFCTNELSAFYFDIRKDSLYCDARSATRRRATRTVIDEAFRRVVTWLAPILCFTMEEAWLLRFPGTDESVHLQTFPETTKGWADEALIAKWDRIRVLRRVVTGALEIKRRDKVIGASLEARPVLYVTDAKDAALFDGLDLGEIAITSHARVSTHAAPDDAFRLPDVAGAAVEFHHAEGDKCARCWMILPEVGSHPEHPDLCNRCSEAVDALA
ncbi:MAG: isoleucine--tRNA ligase [Alphaproteobacteria bacterium]|nr:isoleucine--tRNA ligase [Alphaproteobacteria bacterium]MBL6938012.1 isoleucine--tRNA ligase [Alphaproteobacteria bacterium]MBL7099163.1 isoleucine--tRNA ligase [Alphaproteobacteria bacterium]